MIDLNRDYVVCIWHKTVRTYGAAGKYVDEGTLEAFKVLFTPRPRPPALTPHDVCMPRVKFSFSISSIPQLIFRFIGRLLQL